MTEQVDGTGKAQRPAASHLFLVRLWEESAGLGGNGTHPDADGGSNREWKGKVQHVVSGESHTFQDLPSLLTVLRSMMLAPAPGTPATGQPATEQN
jgi:hypothetical protein